MEEKYLLLLLQIIKNNGSIKSLLENGLEYYQIANYIKFAVDEKYVIINDDESKLTNLGIIKVSELNKKINNRNYNVWISPLYSMRSEKMDKFDIYIPR